MRAVVIEGREQIDVVEQEKPQPGADEVRIRVAAVGVCGSDLHYYFHGANGENVVREPLVPGHELSGRVDHDPTGRWASGTAVTVHPARFGPETDGLAHAAHVRPGGSYLGSAATWPHTQGAMSEYLVVEERMLRALPDDLDMHTATLAEPLAVALHGAGRAGDLHGASVLISGAGPIGLLAIAAARARGAAHITVADVLAEPLRRASALGADAVLRIDEQAAPAERFDVVLECSGAPAAISTAVSAVRRRGTVVQIGMVPNEPRPINLAPLISKEVTLTGALRFLDEIDEAIALLAAEPRIGSIITHRFGIDQVREAFETARDSALSGKVVITLTEAD